MMNNPKLTKPVVDSLELRESDYVKWCGKLTGFGCRVRPTGRKSFIVQYDFGGRSGVTRKVTIGSYGKITVGQAREKAEEILAKVQLGEDVAAAKSKLRSVPTMTALCDEYLAEGCEHKKQSTISTDNGRIERHIKPLLGRYLVTEVTKSNITKFVNDVAKGKTATDQRTGKHGRAIVTGGKGTATRTLRLLGAIFSFAIDQGYIETNPRTGVKGFADNKSERFLSPDELRRLGDTLKLAESDGLPWKFNDGKLTKHRPLNAENQREQIDPFAIAAIRLLLLTGCRAGEILNLRWCDVDFERSCLNLPDSKTGRKAVTLGAPALQILAKLPRVDDNPYVIAGKKPGKQRSDLKRPWKRAVEHAALKGLRIHDLRHSFASVGAASGMGLFIVGKLLGHASPSTTQRYAHLGDDPLKVAAESISSSIFDALDGEAVPNVHQISGKGKI
jgi:integrase